MKKVLLILGLLGLLAGPAVGRDSAPGDVLVVFKGEEGERVTTSSLNMGRDAFRVASIATASGAWVKDTYPGLSEAGNSVFALLHSDSRDAEELAGELLARPDVLAASPNYVVRIARLSDDPITPSSSNGLWGLESIGVPEMWDTATGSSAIRVAVIDTGIDYTNPDLKDNVDYALSRNFCTSDTSAYMDDNGHGTHVAGIIGAMGDNGTGLVGVNWNVKIIALKAMDSDGSGYVSDITQAINYLVELLSADKNLKIAAANLSLAVYASLEPTAGNLAKEPFWRALKTLDRLNRTVIAVAAGNEGLEVGVPAPYNDPSGDNAYSKGNYVYPASFKGLNNMISVAALSQDRTLPYFSNYNADIAAPGVRILSTFMQSSTEDATKKYDAYLLSDGTRVGTASGTSMATPHVAGAAALLLSAVPSLTAYQIRTALVNADETEVQTAAAKQRRIMNLIAALEYQENHTIPGDPLQVVYTEYDKAFDDKNNGNGSGTGTSSGGSGCDASAGCGLFLILLALPWRLRRGSNR
ncbi:MAG: S8 family serine peptidase [Fretibacterium sp.]|nr:S8 family serine peptidase [Fretibacterium sp.]